MKKRVSGVTGVWSDIKIDWKLSVETVYCSKKDGHWRELKWKKTVFKENRLKKSKYMVINEGKSWGYRKFRMQVFLYLSLVSAFSALISLFSDHIILIASKIQYLILKHVITHFFEKEIWSVNFCSFFRGKDILNDVNKLCNY